MTGGAPAQSISQYLGIPTTLHRNGSHGRPIGARLRVLAAVSIHDRSTASAPSPPLRLQPAPQPPLPRPHARLHPPPHQHIQPRQPHLQHLRAPGSAPPFKRLTSRSLFLSRGDCSFLISQTRPYRENQLSLSPSKSAPRMPQGPNSLVTGTRSFRPPRGMQ